MSSKVASQLKELCRGVRPGDLAEDRGQQTMAQGTERKHENGLGVRMSRPIDRLMCPSALGVAAAGERCAARDRANAAETRRHRGGVWTAFGGGGRRGS